MASASPFLKFNFVNEETNPPLDFTTARDIGAPGAKRAAPAANLSSCLYAYATRRICPSEKRRSGTWDFSQKGRLASDPYSGVRMITVTVTLKSCVTKRMCSRLDQLPLMLANGSWGLVPLG